MINVLKRRKAFIENFKPRDLASTFKFKVVIKAMPNKVYKVVSINFNSCTVTTELNDTYNFDEVYLLQYIGYSDINNVDVYEGDILKFTMTRGSRIDTTITEVANVDNQFLIKDNCTYFDTYIETLGAKDSTFEVIGNVFENKYVYHSYSVDIKKKED